MNVSQRRFFTATRFQFEPERLTYQFRNLFGSKQFTVDYADLDTEARQVEEKNSTYLYTGVFLLCAGSALGGVVYNNSGRLGGFLWAVMGLVFLVGFFAQRMRYVVVHSPRDAIIVLSGTQQADVLNEIAKRRKQRYLQILERPDIVADQVKRNGLITALRDNGVLSESEANALLRPANSVLQ